MDSLDILNALTVVSTVDDFDGSTLVGFVNVGGNFDNQYLSMFYTSEYGIVSYEHIGLSFMLSGRDILIVLHSNDSALGLNEGDTMAFLFENGDILEYNIITSAKGKYPLLNSIPITYSDLSMFSQYRLDKWRYSNDSFTITGDNSLFCANSCIPDKACAQDIIIKMASEIGIKALEGYHPFSDVSES